MYKENENIASHTLQPAKKQNKTSQQLTRVTFPRANSLVNEPRIRLTHPVKALGTNGFRRKLAPQTNRETVQLGANSSQEGKWASFARPVLSFESYLSDQPLHLHMAE